MLNFWLKVTFPTHSWRVVVRVFYGLLDVVLFVKAFFIVSDNVHVFVIWNMVLKPLSLLDWAVMDVAFARVVRLLVLFLSRQILLWNRQYLISNDLLEQIVCSRNGVLLEEVYSVHAVLYYLKEHHADYFLHRLAVKVVDEDALHVASCNGSYLAPQHTIVDLFDKPLMSNTIAAFRLCQPCWQASCTARDGIHRGLLWRHVSLKLGIRTRILELCWPLQLCELLSRASRSIQACRTSKQSIPVVGWGR